MASIDELDQRSDSLSVPAEGGASDQELVASLTAANELLISSLSAGHQPATDDAHLNAQIAAYRASIAQISRQLASGGPGHAAAAAGGLGSSSHPQGQDQDQASAQILKDDGTSVLPGLGQEGVDYMVGSVDDLDPSEWQVPPHCIPIHANVTTFDWSRLYQVTSFDVIMMDPPWQLATANPTRGVALGYSQLTDHDIASLPIPQLQQPGGLLFVWVINSKYQLTLDMFETWGYSLVDEIVWVKMTVNRRLFKSHGYYLQHAKEVCMVARKNPTQHKQQQQQQQTSKVLQQQQQQQELHQLAQQLGQQKQQQQQQFLHSDPLGAGLGSSGAHGGWQRHGGSSSSSNTGSSSGVGSDIILSERRGQSQKPEEIYELVEALVPGGRYLEIFARKNNLRNFWVSIGNEVTGTGLPQEDMEAFRQKQFIPGAVYGRGTTGGTAGASGVPQGAAAGGGGGAGAAAMASQIAMA